MRAFVVQAFERIGVWLVLLALTACGASQGQRVPPPASPSPTIVHTATAAPRATATLRPTATATAAPSPTPQAPWRPQYTLHVVVDPATMTVEVHECVRYRNPGPDALPELVLAVEPNRIPQGFTLRRVAVDGREVEKELQGQRLTVALPDPLPPGGEVTLDLDYTLFLPKIGPVDPREQQPRIYGYTAQQINLVDWYPFVVPYDPEQGWVLHPPWYYGEHLVYPAADFEVFLQVTSAAPWVVAASALPEQAGKWQRYRLTGARAFAFSLSLDAEVAEAEWQGIRLRSVFFPWYRAAGEAVLQTMQQAVTTYTRRYGPYPHPSLTGVMGDFDDGMEYSAFFFLPRGFYNLYDGTLKNYLTCIAAHETAHQWWFERVGNDQALHPWMDESLATYSERVFYEDVGPELVDWWWKHRVDYYYPKGWIDVDLYHSGGFVAYVNTVYLNGAHFFEDLRQTMGDEAFFAFLQAYQARMNGRIAAPEDFFGVLREYTDRDLAPLLGAYFRNPPPWPP